jgi:DNA-binding NarL/FixJ family response regulator
MRELIARHTRLVRACARPFFLAGGDDEDLLQEGMIGLLDAIRAVSYGGTFISPEIAQVLKSVDTSGMSTEQIIKTVLRRMVK